MIFHQIAAQAPPKLAIRNQLHRSASQAAQAILIGNPWTFPLIWALIYAVGTSVLGRTPGDTDVTTLSYELLLNSPGEVMVSMFTGGLIMGGIVGVVSFLLAYVFAGRIRLKLLSIKRNRLKKMVLKRAQHG